MLSLPLHLTYMSTAFTPCIEMPCYSVVDLIVLSLLRPQWILNYPVIDLCIVSTTLATRTKADIKKNYVHIIVRNPTAMVYKFKR